MISQFHANIKKYCEKRDTLIAGISGGADSMALLHLLYKAGYKNVIVAHVDHGLRKESKKDAELVHNYANKFAYVFELMQTKIKEVSKKEKIGTEEAGRKIRYAFFKTLAEKYGAKFILTAHHADDNIETIILNLIRGSGIRGLSGLRKRSGSILKPLIHSEKRELVTYCKKYKLKFNEDITNKNIDYSRNFVRHEIIPKIKKLNPNIRETLETTSKIFYELHKYILGETKKYISRQKTNRFSVEEFRKLPKAIQNEIIRRIYKNTYGNMNNLTYNHVQQILKVLNQKKSGKSKEFGKEHMLKTEYYFFYIERK